MDVKKDDGFRTIRGYQTMEESQTFSPAMEDYLEMVARLSSERGCTRIADISIMLHVKPSSASKMIGKLKSSGHLTIDRSGNIYMTVIGKKVANYLLYRHDTIERFLTCIGSTQARRETELIEHFLSSDTIIALETAMDKLQRLDEACSSHVENN